MAKELLLGSTLRKVQDFEKRIEKLEKEVRDLKAGTISPEEWAEIEREINPYGQE